MKKITAIQVFNEQDVQGRFVFSLYDLHKLFPDDSVKALHKSLNRLVKSGLLVHACHGVYVNDRAQSFNSYVIEYIAKSLRRGEYNYVSLEAMLSEYGLISQIPIDRITVMTTGRSGIYQTPYGVIEFTHTKRSANEIIKSMHVIEGRPLRVASQSAAVRDLKRVGRNVNLLIQEDADND